MHVRIYNAHVRRVLVKDIHRHELVKTQADVEMHMIICVRKYLNVIEYVLCGGSDDDGGNSGVFVLLLAEHNDFPTSDLSHFDSNQ